MEISEISSLLDENKPVEVLERTLKYKGKDARVYFLKSEAARLLGKFEEAIIFAQKGNKFARTSEDKIEINLALAKCHRTLGKASNALKFAEVAYDIARKEELLDYAMLSLQEKALALRVAGDLKGAKTLLLEVQEYFESERDLLGLSFINWALGGICRLEGNFKEGIKLFKKSYAYAKKQGDKISSAYALCGLAGILRVSGDVKNCVKNYKLAERIFAHTQDIFGKAYTNCGMANGLRQLGLLKEALVHYRRAQALYTAINDRVDLGFVKWGIADVLKRQSKLEEALFILKEAEILFDGSDEIRGQILTQLSIAQVLYALGDKSLADKLYFAACARAKKECLHTYLEIYT